MIAYFLRTTKEIINATFISSRSQNVQQTNQQFEAGRKSESFRGAENDLEESRS